MRPPTSKLRPAAKDDINHVTSKSGVDPATTQISGEAINQCRRRSSDQTVAAGSSSVINREQLFGTQHCLLHSRKQLIE